jgi:hypothetical protein
MSNENKYQSFAEIVEQVVKANRSKRPSLLIDNLVINDIDRDFYFEDLERTRSNTKQIKNLSNNNLYNNIYNAMNRRGSRGISNTAGSKISSKKELIVVDTSLTKGVTAKELSVDKPRKLSIFDDINTTQRLISHDCSTTDIESNNKVVHHDKLRKINTHPSLRYLKSIINTESVPSDQIQVMNLNNQLKIYEFLTSLCTLIGKLFIILGIFTAVIHYEVEILYKERFTEIGHNEFLLQIKYLAVYIINICTLMYCKFLLI